MRRAGVLAALAVVVALGAGPMASAGAAESRGPQPETPVLAASPTAVGTGIQPYFGNVAGFDAASGAPVQVTFGDVAVGTDLEGAEIAGRRVTVVEDVITTGGQVVISTTDLRALGAIVDHVVCVIDRSPDQAAALTAAGLRLHSLLTRAQLDAAEARHPHTPRST